MGRKKEEIVLAQGLEKRELNLEFAKIEKIISGTPKRKSVKKYKKILKKIKLGQCENVYECVDAENNKKYKIINILGIKIKKRISPVPKIQA